jgi:putative ABC transport system substrate-binding protein
MNRREFITLLGGAATAWPLGAQAQQPAVPLIGLVSGRSIRLGTPSCRVPQGPRRDRLRRRPENVMVEYHWLSGQYDRLPALMADLVRRRVAVRPAATLLRLPQKRPPL